MIACWVCRSEVNPTNCTCRSHPCGALTASWHYCCVCTAGSLSVYFSQPPSLIFIQTCLCGLSRDFKSPGSFVSIFYSPVLHKHVLAFPLCTAFSVWVQHFQTWKWPPKCDFHQLWPSALITYYPRSAYVIWWAWPRMADDVTLD